MVKFELNFSNNDPYNSAGPSQQDRLDVMCEIHTVLQDLYEKKKSKMRNAGIFVNKIEDITNKPKETTPINKRVMIVKVDTTGLDLKGSKKLVGEIKTQLMEILTKEERDQFIIICMPTYEGDNSDIKIIG